MNDGLPPDRLFNRNFTLIISSQCVALLGNALYSVVLVLYLKQMTGSATVLGVMELLAFLPMVLLGPFAGALVDRSDRKRVIAWSYFLSGMLMLVLFIFSLDRFAGPKVVDIGIARISLSAFPFTVYVVLCVTVCLGVIDSVFNAALNSVIPAILRRDKIQRGNSLFHGMGGAVAIAGSALGGILFSVLGAALVFLINGVSYMAAAFTSLFMSIGRKGAAGREASSYSTFIGEVKEGFVFIWANKGLRDQTIVYMLSNLIFPAVMLSLPFLVEDVMKLGSAYYGYLLSIFTLSSVAGSFLFGLLRTTDRQNYVVICAIFCIEALLFLLLSFTTNVFLVFALFSILSFCMAVSRLINTSIKQKVIPGKIRGRAFGTLDSINGALVPLSFGLSGILIDMLGRNILLIFSIIFVIYAALAVIFISSGSIRRFYLASEVSGEEG